MHLSPLSSSSSSRRRRYVLVLVTCANLGTCANWKRRIILIFKEATGQCGMATQTSDKALHCAGTLTRALVFLTLMALAAEASKCEGQDTVAFNLVPRSKLQGRRAFTSSQHAGNYACLAFGRAQLWDARLPSSANSRAARLLALRAVPVDADGGSGTSSLSNWWGSGRRRGRVPDETSDSGPAQHWEQPPPDGTDLSVHYRARISYCTRRRARAVSTISAVDLLVEDLPEFDMVEVAGLLVRAHRCLLSVVAHPRAGLRQQRAAWAASRRYDLSLVICSDAFLARMNAEWHGSGVTDRNFVMGQDEGGGRRGRSPDRGKESEERDIKWLCFPQMTRGGMVGDLLVSYEAAARAARTPPDRGAPGHDKMVQAEIQRQVARMVLRGLVSLLDISEDEERKMLPFQRDIFGEEFASRSAPREGGRTGGHYADVTQQTWRRPRGQRAVGGRGRGGARVQTRGWEARGRVVGGTGDS
jgi:hypothetical protein